MTVSLSNSPSSISPDFLATSPTFKMPSLIFWAASADCVRMPPEP